MHMNTCKFIPLNNLDFNSPSKVDRYQPQTPLPVISEAMLCKYCSYASVSNRFLGI